MPAPPRGCASFTISDARLPDCPLGSAPEGDAEAICDHPLAELAYGDLDDDIALLVVRVLA